MECRGKGVRKVKGGVARRWKGVRGKNRRERETEDKGEKSNLEVREKNRRARAE